MAGKLRPGDRLIEAELTEMFGVGRGSVREALRRLEANKYIVFEANRGASVAQPSPLEIANMLRIRGVIAGLGARAAAENARQPEARALIDAMFAAIEEDKAEQNPQRHRYYNARFHRAVNELSRNGYVSSMLDEVNIPMLYGQYFRMLSTEQWQYNIEDHIDIARAIRKADPDAAAHFAEQHMLRAVPIASDIAENM
ncbi:MAG: GntR family transcriptional regulator [Devosia sp.]|nr:GntR family transcriptional regulator [Devosia sp.]